MSALMRLAALGRSGSLSTGSGSNGGTASANDAFSAKTYVGNGAAQSVLSYLDLVSNGAQGMVMIKFLGPNNPNNRGMTVFNTLEKNAQGGPMYAARMDTNGARYVNESKFVISSNGFSMDWGFDTGAGVNSQGDRYVAYSFKKSPKFFDLLTYTGNGLSLDVPHQLGQTPGAIIIKNHSSGDWFFAHRAVGQLRMGPGGAGASAANTYINAMNGLPPSSGNVGSGGGGAGWYGGNGGNGGYGGGGGGAAGYTGNNYGGRGGDGLLVILHGTTIVILTSGNNSLWTVPTGVTRLKAWLIGAGGGGAGAYASDSFAGGGGGAGGCCYKEFNVTPGTTITFTIGVGGLPGNPGDYGGNGTQSILTYSPSGVAMYARGGFGGIPNGNQVAEGGDAIGGDTNSYGGRGAGATGDDGGGGGGGINNGHAPETRADMNTGGQGGTGVDYMGLSNALDLTGGINGTAGLILNSSLGIQAGPNASVQGVNATAFTPYNGNAYSNISGNQYTAYLFGHDVDPATSTIYCGSYIGSGTVGQNINIGWEPQFLMVKKVDGTGDWYIVDSARGMPMAGGYSFGTATITTSAEILSPQLIASQPLGFSLETTDTTLNEASQLYIYIAIRRSTKKPTTGSEVLFQSAVGPGASQVAQFDNADFGLALTDRYNNTGGFRWYDRVRGVGRPTQPVPALLSQHAGVQGVYTASTEANTFTEPTAYVYENTLGLSLGSNNGYYSGSVGYLFKRAAGFMDIASYLGDGQVMSHRPHNLGVAPQLVITKSLTAHENWLVYFSIDPANAVAFYLNSTEGSFGNGSNWVNNKTFLSQNNGWFGSNLAGHRYIAYLFATLAGVSKVGYYQGNDAVGRVIDCGFSNGARFVLIKSASAGDWMLWDSARGIVDGSEPQSNLGGVRPERVTDSIDPHPSGFIVNYGTTENINSSVGTYYFLAIA